jgi:hypothetical protein
MVSYEVIDKDGRVIWETSLTDGLTHYFIQAMQELGLTVRKKK